MLSSIGNHLAAMLFDGFRKVKFKWNVMSFKLSSELVECLKSVYRLRSSLSRKLPKCKVKFLTILCIWWHESPSMSRRCRANSRMRSSSTYFSSRIELALSISKRFSHGRSYFGNRAFIFSNTLAASTEFTSTDAKCSTAIDFCPLL